MGLLNGPFPRDFLQPRGGSEIVLGRSGIVLGHAEVELGRLEIEIGLVFVWRRVVAVGEHT